jgi:hypothetical protein
MTPDFAIAFIFELSHHRVAGRIWFVALSIYNNQVGSRTGRSLCPF